MQFYLTIPVLMCVLERVGEREIERERERERERESCAVLLYVCWNFTKDDPSSKQTEEGGGSGDKVKAPKTQKVPQVKCQSIKTILYFHDILSVYCKYLIFSYSVILL